MIYRKGETEGYLLLKKMALSFVEQMKVGEEPGAYKK